MTRRRRPSTGRTEYELGFLVGMIERLGVDAVHAAVDEAAASPLLTLDEGDDR